MADINNEQSYGLQQHEYIFELVNDSIMTRTMEGRINFWNRSAEHLYGWRKEEAIGKVSHSLLQTQFPKPLEEIESELVQNGRWEGKLMHTTRDGGRVVVESRWALDLREQSGAVVEINTPSTTDYEIDPAARTNRHSVEVGKQQPVSASKLMKADDLLPKTAKIGKKSDPLSHWDNVWTEVKKTDWSIAYTTGKPRSIAQLGQRGYFEDLWNSLGPRAPKARYLELGAGRGTTATYLAARGCDVTMVDNSSSAFDLARANFAALGLKEPSFVMTDARNTGLRGESWDCVYAIGLLEHFEDPVPILDESVRLLSPGGLLFHVIVP